MKSKFVWALVALNVLLTVTLVTRWMKPTTAMAAQAAAGRPGDYIMVPAEVVGGSSALIYVIDTSNNQLSGIAFEQNTLQALAPIDLARVFQAGQPAGGAGGRNRND